VIKLSIHVSQQVPNMFSFLKRKSKKTEDVQVEEQLEQIIEKPVISEPSTLEADIASNAIVEPESSAVDVPSEPVVEEKKPGLFGRLKERLSKTSSKLTSGFASLILGKKTIDDDLLEELETQLLTADLGIDATQTIINDLTQRVARKQLGDAVALFSALRDDMVDILEPSSLPLVIPEKEGPYVILMVGINGVGKTTTIGKLAKQFQSQGKSVMLAAGDTFRAAAVEQLQVWGDRNNIPVISQHSGADSASVIFDALQAAKARNTDILIADTAGRLHTQSNLMEELKKVKRVMAKLDVEAPHEIMLVLDAGTGQNALSQAVQFNEAVGVTGITLTKLDGTAKGGIIFAIAKKTGLPIRYIGVGETIDDLRPFKADEFVDALLGREE
jgi:fused signal recognition particle receptor